MSRGPWVHRFTVYLLAVALAVLIFWFLGFVVRDIRSIEGPQYVDIESRYVDRALMEKSASLDMRMAELSRGIDRVKEKKRVVEDGIGNLQRTIGQLAEFQRLSLQKGVALSDTEQNNLAASLQAFLENQKRCQDLDQELSILVDQRRALEDERLRVGRDIEVQRRPAMEEFNRFARKHDLKLAALQLALLVPLLAATVFLVIRGRSSIYFPALIAPVAATLLKVSLVIHEYFPSRAFKYVLIVALILVVARLLVYFVRSIAFPKAQWLARQYREAYERFLCPVCDYPIRTGPRRFLYWTRRTVNRTVLPEASGTDQDRYACPSCGTSLFDECVACHKMRHVMLPFCEHCGNQVATPGSPDTGDPGARA